MTFPSFHDSPSIKLLQWLARGSLKQNLLRSLRLWVWLRFLYDADAFKLPFSHRLPDPFTFYSTSEGIDRIVDYSWSQGDKIAVSAGGFGGGLTVGALLTSQFTTGAAATTANHRFIYNSATGALFFDRDGIGTTAQIQIATLSPSLALISSDIQVIA